MSILNTRPGGAVGFSDWLGEIARIITSLGLGVYLGTRYQARRMRRGVGPACLKALDDHLRHLRVANPNRGFRDTRSCPNSAAASLRLSSGETPFAKDSIREREVREYRLVSPNETKMSRRERGRAWLRNEVTKSSQN
jgi:hypothetical protein